MSTVKLLDGLYHVGSGLEKKGLNCNPYLLIDGNEGILIDPGSVLDFEIVYNNVIKLIPISNVKYVILHHEDPDFCGAVPLFEKEGLDAEIITSWRNMTLIQYYGTKSPFYIIEEHHNNLRLSSGKILNFIATPYLHFAGSFVTYYPLLKVLFSSDLFGAFSYNLTFYADENYVEKMKAFHEHYMPSNRILRPVMELLSHYDIDMILPQHGSIIKDDVYEYIDILKNLECGSLMFPVKEALMSHGGFIKRFNEIIKRLKSIYAPEDIKEFFTSCSCFTFDENFEIIDYNDKPSRIWSHMFDHMAEQQKYDWLMMVEPLVKQMIYHYDLPEPNAYKELLKSVNNENERLVQVNEALENTIRLVNEKLIKCPITGLYNESFFRTLLLQELESEDWRDIGIFACVDVDNFSKYKLIHGVNQGEDALNTLIYQFAEVFNHNTLFKMDNSDLGLYIKGIDKKRVIELLDTVRLTISKSDAFLSPLTISIGVVFPKELKLDAPAYDLVVDDYLKRGHDRMRQAKYLGSNIISYEGTLEIKPKDSQKVLIVDSDETNIDVIESFLKETGTEVFKAYDGMMALELAATHTPDLIVTEVNLPKLDGFILCERLMGNSKTKNIPIIFLSYHKDEASVTRAQALGVSYYFKKPYLLYELIGIIKHFIKA